MNATLLLYLDRARTRWAALAPREQRILGVGGIVLAGVILFLGVWEPMVAARKERREALDDARAVAAMLEQLAVEKQRNRGPAAAGSASQSLLAVVDASRRASGVTKPPSRLQPEGDATVRIWLEDVPFDALLRWLAELQQRHGVRVDTADIERESAPGLVNARLTLMR
ncbi:MAG TPA: type II secretion system protein M [Verrucomicrobiae bacterium]|nr:type II secretion system protein M [Verrucomicrobiae bacterium]